MCNRVNDKMNGQSGQKDDQKMTKKERKKKNRSDKSLRDAKRALRNPSFVSELTWMCHHCYRCMLDVCWSQLGTEKKKKTQTQIIKCKENVSCCSERVYI